jgi:uncharacterized protein YjcR
MTAIEKRKLNRAEAQRLFFHCRQSVKEIAAALGLHPQTVRGYLREHENYADEILRRREEHQENRKAKKRKWASDYRATGRLGNSITEKAILKNQHRRDVGVLTYERYCTD